MIESHSWNEKMDVGHEAMDHDHHAQIALVSAFVDALEQGRPAMATKVVEQLEKLSDAHFHSEELLMDLAGYPQSRQHGGEHDALLAKIGEAKSAHREGNRELAVSLALDFRSTLAAHMNDADRRVAEHVRGGAAARRQ
jgi:hemerythrin